MQQDVLLLAEPAEMFESKAKEDAQLLFSGLFFFRFWTQQTQTNFPHICVILIKFSHKASHPPLHSHHNTAVAEPVSGRQFVARLHISL